MGTIQPRLMHLLNDAKLEAAYESPPDLPPIQGYNSFANSSSLSLPPLEPDAGHRGDKSAPKAQQIPSLYSITDDGQPRQFSRHHEVDYFQERPRQTGHSLRMLLDNPEVNESSHSLSHILDDTPETTEEASTKKRHRALTVKEDFVQLPQPLKKQKSSQQVVPPIINGLHEPPPNAAVFPPISSGNFDDNDGMGMCILKDYAPLEDRAGSGTPMELDKAAAKSKRKAAKPRRKWSEEETNDLLRGVGKHGVGKWTSILEDPEFRFNERSAGDLKDRFRTCCPDELRSALGKNSPLEGPAPAVAAPSRSRSKGKGKSALPIEDILDQPDELPEKETEKALTSQQDSDANTKQRKSRAHRKKVEDLQSLGIHGPFKKSHRRERRPFTEQDDKEILEGLQQYGPAWTKIQRDPRYNLNTRQPTDLRDRVRNKYPETYANIEKGMFQIKEPGRANNLLEPSVNTTIENSLSKSGPLEPNPNRTNSKEEMPRWLLTSGFPEPDDSHPNLQTLDQLEQSSSAFVGSVEQMDISRLLLN